MASDYNVVTRLQKSSIIFQEKGGYTIGTNLNSKLYKEIVERIIEPGLNKFEAKDELAQILENYKVSRLENDASRYDLKTNIERFLKDKELQGISPLTLDGYRWQLSIFGDYYADKRVQDIERKDIMAFLEYRGQSKRVTQKTTLETIRSILKVFFDWLKDEDIIEESPLAKIKPFRLPKLMARALTVEELEMLRESCKTPRERAMLEVLYSTGCRLAEVAALNIHDIDWTNRSIKVLGKGDKERMVFFAVRASIYLRKYLDERKDDCPALFVTERRPYRRLSMRGIQRDIEHIGTRAGIKKKVHPNVLRHTFATLMLNKGCPMSVVQELLGHDDLASTQTYAKVTYEHKHHCYEKYFYQ